jgi:hypothetical protein
VLADPLECADCHPGIVASWGETAMARAIDVLRPGEFAGLEPVDDGVGFRYQLVEAGGRARLVETYADGIRPHRESSSIDFAIGAGTLDRSYVVKKHRRMWFAPVEVVTQDHGAGRAAAGANDTAAVLGAGAAPATEKTTSDTISMATLNSVICLAIWI